jgi:hypothetical protein
MITQQELKSKFHYDQDTGIFHRLKNGEKSKVAGSLTFYGYLQIQINYKFYQAHRLAWLYVYGETPSKCIDHIDCNKTNNKINNLRLSTHSENQKNRPKQKNNTSGYKGVCFDKRFKRWCAGATLNYKKIYLGSYSTAEEAHEAYVNFAKNNHGDFVYANY